RAYAGFSSPVPNAAPIRVALTVVRANWRREMEDRRSIGPSELPFNTNSLLFSCSNFNFGMSRMFIAFFSFCGIKLRIRYFSFKTKLRHLLSRVSCRGNGAVRDLKVPFVTGG